MASHTTPLWVCFSARPLSDPLECAARTNGHSGLNHSRTTVLPRCWLRRTDRPSRSRSSKSGAGLPISAETVAAAAALFATAGAALASVDGEARLHAEPRQARATNGQTRSFGRK